jgi:predicted amidohydrolase
MQNETRIIQNLRVFFIGSILLLRFFTDTSSLVAQEKKTTDWQFHTQRAEIEPAHWVDHDLLYEGRPTLAISGDGKAYANGSWTRNIDVTEENYYEFITYVKPDKVTQIDRSVLAQLTWFNKAGDQVGFVEYPGFRAEAARDGWFVIQQKYQVPENAVEVRIDLIYRWDPEGTVYFGGTNFAQTAELVPRPVRFAAIHYRPIHTVTSQENLEQFKKHIITAGEKNADIVCLPEGITLVGTKQSYVEAGEPIPGPSTEFLGQLAKQYSMYIVAGIYEKEGPALYNTSILIGRDGELLGKYRKTALPQEEINGGITPGDSYPVFDTDFGRIGMMICWDVSFPEPARALALQGAEVIFMPIWGGNLTLAKARAIENQVYLVSSSYDMKTGVFDRRGELVVEGTEDRPVAMIDVDLNQRELWWWLGEFRNRITRERPRDLCSWQY